MEGATGMGRGREGSGAREVFVPSLLVRVSLGTADLLLGYRCSVFDVPVFWPILVLYWLILFTVTMKRQIMHVSDIP
jgi:hypothetical protein